MSDDLRQDFWHYVDSQTICPLVTEWSELRDGECIALMSDRRRCNRPAMFGWCSFHFDRMVDFVADVREERVLVRIRQRNPEAFRFLIDAGRLRDAQDVLEAAGAQVYFIACQDHVKIGYSKNPIYRLSQLQHQRNSKARTLVPEGLDLSEAVLVGCIPGGQYAERELHSLLRNYRTTGEWFRLTPTVIAAIDCLVFGEAPPRAIEAGLRDIYLHGGGSTRRRNRAGAA